MNIQVDNTNLYYEFDLNTYIYDILFNHQEELYNNNNNKNNRSTKNH